ncbi:MAG: prolipoprotein diacylglyceryl transferase [Planctomycetes bacterium]|nr:prolipoprotein diacylglyceryl transferase [Planctomycetota bacterium]
MYPSLFEIPILHLKIGTFGPMMVLGFLAALFLMRRLTRRANLDPSIMTNAALYSLIAGVVGARVFFVVHHLDQFRGNPIDIIATWRGGLEFLGGVIVATCLLLLYLHFSKLPIRRYLDIIVIGLMMGLAFGRIGCFLNADCFGKPTSLPWGIRFPYGSFVYISQINPDPDRNRSEPHLHLPQSDYLDFYDKEGKWYPKALENLTDTQQYEVTKGKYRCLAVHPSQLYSSANALLLCLILYLFWRKSLKRAASDKTPKRLNRPGAITALMLILYGITRFLIEFIRDDNPYEIGFLTISQILGIVMIISGIALLTLLPCFKSDTQPDTEVADTK